MRLIRSEPGSIGVAFEMKPGDRTQRVRRVMGDRLWESERDRAGSVPFLGRHARFPLGPFLLQAALGCPLLFTVCVRMAPGCYAASAEPLARAGVIPRGDRAKHAEELARRYAATLQESCVRTPYQWFNFFEFWRNEAGA